MYAAVGNPAITGTSSTREATTGNPNMVEITADISMRCTEVYMLSVLSDSY